MKTPARPEARIAIDAARCAPAISRRLFGKFTEHLGHNVHLGAWAQVLPNPEFAPADRWSAREALTRRLTRQQEALGPEDLVRAVEGGSAPYWVPRGRLDGRIVEAAGRDVQKLTGTGRIETLIFLPLARVRAFDLTLTARADQPAAVRASLRTTGGTTLAEAAVKLTPEWATHAARLTVPEDFVHEPGTPHVFAVEIDSADVELARALLFPADHLDGWDPEIVAFLRQACLPLLRFPGGNFASGYHWEDGVGPADGRPVLPNPAWGDCVEFNHVGTDEWIRLCELVGAEPMICVNAGDGTAEEARRWVEYCNGPPDTPMGRRRADNGRGEPCDVRIWEIGNELYGKWQIGQVDAAGYADRYLSFTRAMQTADDGLLFIACGWDADWNRTLVDIAGPAVRSIAEHFLVGGKIPPEADDDPRGVFEEFMAHADAFGEELEKYYAPMVAAGLEPRIAITEQMIFTHRSAIPDSDNLAEALWTAGLTNAAIRTGGIVEMITHSALVNHGGGLRKQRGVVYANPVWWVTHLYASQAGVVPAEVRVDSPTFSTPGKWLTERSDAACLDAVALLSESGDECSLFVVNRHAEMSIAAEIEIRSFRPASEADAITLTGETVIAANTWDHPRRVFPQPSAATVAGGSFQHTFPPRSLTRITLKSS